MGCVVIDEDLSILGSNGEKYKEFYIEKKFENVKPKKIKLRKKKEKSNTNIVNEDELEVIQWKDFQNVEVLEAGVCGLKVCCIRVSYLGKNYILKEMRPSFRYGRDYMLIDKLKKHFNINDLGMKRIKSNI